MILSYVKKFIFNYVCRYLYVLEIRNDFANKVINVHFQ